MNTEYELNLVKKFLIDHRNLGSAAKAFDQALENIETNIRWVETNFNDVLEWLSSFEY